MTASNELQKAAPDSRYERLRLVPEVRALESKDMFAGQRSEQAQRMRGDIERVARRPFNILITGETGTGKTQMARQIHRLSRRANKPFIELNCANLPEHLVEAELFGYRKGAFTGADHDRKGLFEEAGGGILFLDEIGDIALPVQIRLLKAIDEKQIRRLGDNHCHSCDVQIIAATSRNLSAMIQSGAFREDLYCRLAVLTVEASPLRDRRADIPAMVALFLREATDVIQGRLETNARCRIEDDALELLCEFDYPGNVRTLRNVIYELTSYLREDEPISVELVEAVLAKAKRRLPKDMTDELFQPDPVVKRGSNKSQEMLRAVLNSMAGEGDIVLPIELCFLRRGETFKQWTARAKRSSIEAARQATGGTAQSAADRLGLTRSSLMSHLHRAKHRQSESLFD